MELVSHFLSQMIRHYSSTNTNSARSYDFIGDIQLSTIQIQYLEVLNDSAARYAASFSTPEQPKTQIPCCLAAAGIQVCSSCPYEGCAHSNN
jgi:hypothetical protein